MIPCQPRGSLHSDHASTHTLDTKLVFSIISQNDMILDKLWEDIFFDDSTYPDSPSQVLLPLNYGVLMVHTLRILGFGSGLFSSYYSTVGGNGSFSALDDAYFFGYGSTRTPTTSPGAGISENSVPSPLAFLQLPEGSSSADASSSWSSWFWRDDIPVIPINKSYGAEILRQLGHDSPEALQTLMSSVDLSEDAFSILDLPPAEQTAYTHMRNAARLAIADVTIQTADIWEAWALWSVLKMFTTIVDSVAKTNRNKRANMGGSDSAGTSSGAAGVTRSRAERGRRGSAEAAIGGLAEPLLGGGGKDAGGVAAVTAESSSIAGFGKITPSSSSDIVSRSGGEQTTPDATIADRAVTAFQRFALAVLKCYVFTSMLANIAEVSVKGILGIHFPSVCPFLLRSCDFSCQTWWDDFVGPYDALIISSLCSAAIYCVFVFEGAFRGELEQLEPYWKFFGVKGVVSVTWTQWLVIRYLVFGYNYQWLA